MIRTILFCLTFITGIALPGFSQTSSSTGFGIKGGAGLAIQQWDGYQRRPLLAYHGIAFIESVPEANEFALFAQLGIHQKGSTIGGNYFTDRVTGTSVRSPIRKYIFNNLSLSIGAKQKFDLKNDSKWYYLLGVRGDYNVQNNLDTYNDGVFISTANPFPEFVQDFTYGVIIGGGIEFPLSDLVSGLMELTLNPDLSNQYVQRGPITVPGGTYGPITIPANSIKNTVLELTVGIRFIRKVIYID